VCPGYARAGKLDRLSDLHPGDTFTARPMTFVCFNEGVWAASPHRVSRASAREPPGAQALRKPAWSLQESEMDHLGWRLAGRKLERRLRNFADQTMTRRPGKAL